MFSDYNVCIFVDLRVYRIRRHPMLTSVKSFTRKFCSFAHAGCFTCSPIGYALREIEINQAAELQVSAWISADASRGAPCC